MKNRYSVFQIILKYKCMNGFKIHCTSVANATNYLVCSLVCDMWFIYILSPIFIAVVFFIALYDKWKLHWYIYSLFNTKVSAYLLQSTTKMIYLILVKTIWIFMAIVVESSYKLCLSQFWSFTIRPGARGLYKS